MGLLQKEGKRNSWASLAPLFAQVRGQLQVRTAGPMLPMNQVPGCLAEVAYGRACP